MARLEDGEFIKNPSSELDYTVNWASKSGVNDGSAIDTGWLQGDTIVTSSWEIPAELTRITDVHTDTTATLIMGGGVIGEVYTVRNTIDTVGGRTDVRSITIIMKYK